MTYVAHFIGRRKGSIGICQNFQVPVIASSLEAAQLKLYDTHEHIGECIIVRQVAP